jgi:hypothetical protein
MSDGWDKELEAIIVSSIKARRGRKQRAYDVRDFCGIALRCVHCKTVIQSLHHHDFKFCACGKIAIDGGHEYFRALGEFADMEVVDETVEGVIELSERNKIKFKRILTWLHENTHKS